MTRRRTLATTIPSLLLGTACALGILAGTTPAKADWDHGRGGWRHEEWRHDGWRRDGWRYRGWAAPVRPYVYVPPPRVYYAPPPGYYAPPPTYYAPPPGYFN